VTWIVEIASQILFSNTASVNYELLIGRDERSLEVGFAAIAGKGHGEPGHVQDFQQRTSTDGGRRPELPKGVYSRAVQLVVEDTTRLWDKPTVPRWEREEVNVLGEKDVPIRRKKQKKMHIVILTHGLHSNVGADMLYLKESIDATAKQARADSKKRREALRKGDKEGTKEKADIKEIDPGSTHAHESVAPANLVGGQEELEEDEDDEESEDEQVIVRGFSGNAIRTERGIQYLGKRLAKFVLTATYPTQPYLPPSKSLTRRLTGYGKSNQPSSHYGTAGAAGSIPDPTKSSGDLPYVFTSISFIGHSLGGLVQTYAIAYIHKHSPDFFTKIKPINFVTMASPLLGLSNENPLYVKFALDFGLVGRTGQDLGLTWRPPTIARSGWSAMISGLGVGNKEEHEKQPDPLSKPLLRILPTGPAHQVLKMFRNRTVYSNVVNDGIVPLRTSCLLFLDWRGLDKVENARRENGLITTLASVGWAELTGSNTFSHRPLTARMQDDDDLSGHSGDEKGSRARTNVPQPSNDATRDDNRSNTQEAEEPEPHQFLDPHQQEAAGDSSHIDSPRNSTEGRNSTAFLHPIDGIMNLLRPKPDATKSSKVSKRSTRSFQRAQTVMHDDANSSGDEHTHHRRPLASRGDSMEQEHRIPPPKTSVFEAAGDLISPPQPPESWIIDPSKRARTIFHDRIYHPEDIPPPPTRRPRFGRSFSSSESIRPKSADGSNFSTSHDSSKPSRSDSVNSIPDMKVEEKIARAYHRDLSWRKVLVRLEPDAHNNMVVRRMFANAYGWDVIKHLCDTHFSDNAATCKPDHEESGRERAKPAEESVGHTGTQVKEDDAKPRHRDIEAKKVNERPELQRTVSEKREASDSLSTLDTQSRGISTLTSGGADKSPSSTATLTGPRRGSLLREDSALWSDAVFDDTEPDSDDEGWHTNHHQAHSQAPTTNTSGIADTDRGAEAPANPFEAFRRYWNGTAGEDKQEKRDAAPAPASGSTASGGPPRPAGRLLRGLSLQTNHRPTSSSSSVSPSYGNATSSSPTSYRRQSRSQLQSHGESRIADTITASPTASSPSTPIVAEPDAYEPPRQPYDISDALHGSVDDVPAGVFTDASIAGAAGTSGVGLQKPAQARLAIGGVGSGSVMRAERVDDLDGLDKGKGGRKARAESMSERVARLAGSAGP
jgi:hypothetical protein